LETVGYRAFVNVPQLSVKHALLFDPVWLREQVKMAEKDGLHSLIFSAEMISTFNSDQLKCLINTFYTNTIILVTCFRHWIGFLPSKWAQYCARRDAQSFRAYLDSLIDRQDKHIDARFDLIIKSMISVNPDDIRLISYDNAVRDESLMSTILSAFDLPPNFVNKSVVSSKRYNVRVNTEVVELVRLFNGVYSIGNGLRLNELFDAVYDAIPVTKFYDFAPRILSILKERKKLEKKLLAMTKNARSCILLSESDRHIAEWKKMTEDVAGDYLYNPKRSMLFCDVADRSFAYSELEATDLPVSIQAEIATALSVEEF
jgi:hypothetical protein